MISSLVDDDGNDVPKGQPGEALVKGPVITKGYHNNDEANKKAFTADGWLRTGDIIHIDANNLFHIVDRKKVSLHKLLAGTRRLKSISNTYDFHRN